MVVVKLLIAGVPRVMGGKAGMTFIVDSFTTNVYGLVANVRDYRFGDRYQIWSISFGGYEIIQDVDMIAPEGKIVVRDLLINQIQDALGTAEIGLDLVKVARNAHNAKQELASVKRDLELLQESIEHDWLNQ